jgi:predicted transcriptional regulator
MLGNLKKRRRKVKPRITMKDLSRESGISVSRICEIEKSPDANYTKRTEKAILTALVKLESERIPISPTAVKNI